MLSDTDICRSTAALSVTGLEKATRMGIPTPTFLPCGPALHTALSVAVGRRVLNVDFSVLPRPSASTARATTTNVVESGRLEVAVQVA